MMKKTLITMAVCLSAFFANGQESQPEQKTVRQKKTKTHNEDQLKANRGAISTELNFNPFKGDLKLNNSLNQIKFRFFTKPDFAIRVGFNASSVDSTFSSKNYYGTNTNANYESKRESFTIGANIGFEKHFKGTRRLSPFIGVDISVTDRSANQKITSGQVVTEYKNSWASPIPYTYYNGSSTQVLYSINPSDYGYTRVGLHLITGFDFYMAKNFFLGYEFNFGINSTKYKDTEITQTGNTSTTPINDPVLKNKSLSFGPTLMNGIRIGYIF
ncbi:autotransporter outer membrane beta-barrel domain-containing protein [Desertivirga brevis]|uniref:autotransporter outer membrane beta-barrel domain-containing protein n=1 Tax=Desertivirga brevis TaxID=2810310 RepID=UPI001A971DB3|nr:autotransporter outer membrane beta-barrel domain-containing protein [Pedobacter sp. SYSU D00873]